MTIPKTIPLLSFLTCRWPLLPRSTGKTLTSVPVVPIDMVSSGVGESGILKWLAQLEAVALLTMVPRALVIRSPMVTALTLNCLEESSVPTRVSIRGPPTRQPVEVHGPPIALLLNILIKYPPGCLVHLSLLPIQRP